MKVATRIEKKPSPIKKYCNIGISSQTTSLASMDVGNSELNSGAFVTWKLVQNFWHLPEFTDVPRNTSEISCEM